MLALSGKNNIPKNEWSKNELARALLELLEEKDFQKITNKDITDRAGLSHITYYRNFSSKEEILKYHLQNVTNSFIRRTGILYTPDDFRGYLILLFSHMEDYRDLGNLLNRTGLIHLIKNEFDRIFPEKASSRKDMYRYSFIAGGLFNLYYRWLCEGFRETPEELADMFLDFTISSKKE